MYFYLFICLVRDQFPTAQLTKIEISEMIAKTPLQGEYAVSKRNFFHAAALWDLENHSEKIEQIFEAIDAVNKLMKKLIERKWKHLFN